MGWPSQPVPLDFTIFRSEPAPVNSSGDEPRRSWRASVCCRFGGRGDALDVTSHVDCQKQQLAVSHNCDTEDIRRSNLPRLASGRTSSMISVMTSGRMYMAASLRGIIDRMGPISISHTVRSPGRHQLKEVGLPQSRLISERISRNLGSSRSRLLQGQYFENLSRATGSRISMDIRA